MAEDSSRDISVMSYNVLTTSTQPITAANPEGRTRGEMLTDLIDVWQPDSIGLNEVTSNWMDYISNEVVRNDYTGTAEYAVAGLTSDAGLPLLSGSAEYSPLLYRSDKYEVVTEGGAWFSATPALPSKYGDIKDGNGNVLYSGMKFNRILSYVVFKDKDANEIAYIHINAHYDHQSADYINRLCSVQVQEKADELSDLYDCPVVISGDFNSTETSEAYNYLDMGANGYLNAKYMTDNYSVLSSCPGYGSSYNETATDVIDHIFISDNIGVYEHKIIPNAYLSDHSCVMVRLSLDFISPLQSITLDNEVIDGFKSNTYRYALETDKESILIGGNYEEGSALYINNMLYNGNAVDINLSDGKNEVKIIAEKSGLRTVYTLSIYKSYGIALPVISEVYPNAREGYRYFEVTNAGTKSFSTSDYYFLWGNITDENQRTWEGVFEPRDESENTIVGPGETVIFWLTYGGSFANNNPAIADFNNEYGTALTDGQIVMSDVSQPIKGYLNGEVKTTFTMGSMNTRGMRIAKAKNEAGEFYEWNVYGTNGNSYYTGPTVSVSSYHSISTVKLTQTQIFKFKYMPDSILTAVSDILDASYASPGIYDKRLGNEKKDAYTPIEAEEFDGYSVAKAEDTTIGNTKSGSWVYYSNVVFGENGAQSVSFYGSVKGSNASGTIQVYIDGKADGNLGEATLVGSCETTATAPSDWNTFALFNCELNRIVTGTHNVILKFMPSKTYVINLDYFYFSAFVPKEDIREVSDFRFILDGGEVGAQGVVKSASPKENTFLLEEEAVYLPVNADYSLLWESNNTDIAQIDGRTGEITVKSRGDVTFTVYIYTNNRLFTSFTSPIISFDYKIDAFELIECEWVSAFTSGININGETAWANLQYKTGASGMSSNITKGYNLIGNTVNLSTARYNSVDFGESGISELTFNMALRTNRCIGTVQIYELKANGDYGDLIGYCTVTAADATDSGAGNYNTFKEFKGVITKAGITGVHDIVLKFVTDVNYVGNIDYFYFE